MLIGLGGYAYSGKDTVAEILARDYSFINLGSFSVGLNDCLLVLNPIIAERACPTCWDHPGLAWAGCGCGRGVKHLVDCGTRPSACRDCGGARRELMRYADYFEECGAYEAYSKFKEHPEVRRLLQVMGTEVGRRRIDPDVWVLMKEREMEPHLVDGSDVVITAIRFPNEAMMINSHGGFNVWVSRPGYGPVNSHASDNSLSVEDFEYEITNDGTLEDLTVDVSTMANFFRTRA